MIRLKTLLREQLLGMALSNSNTPSFNLSKGTDVASGKTPDVETDDAMNFEAEFGTATTSQQRFAETYKKARVMTYRSDSNATRKAQQLNTAIQGIGNNAQVLTVFKSIKTLQEFSNVIWAYKNKFNTTLYADLSSEIGLSWDSIWNSIKHLNPGVSQRNASSMAPL